MYKLIDGLNQGLVPTDMGQNYVQAKTDQRRTQTRTATQRIWDYSDHELYCDRKLHFYGSKWPQMTPVTFNGDFKQAIV